MPYPPVNRVPGRRVNFRYELRNVFIPDNRNAGPYAYEIARVDTFHELYRQQAEERQNRARKAQAAELRARELLKTFLNPWQLETLGLHHYIDVRGSAGGQYRVFTDAGVSHNVLDTEHSITFCYHLEMSHIPYPTSDHLLTQLMIIATDQASLARYPANQLHMPGWGYSSHLSPAKMPPFVPWRCE